MLFIIKKLRFKKMISYIADPENSGNNSADISSNPQGIPHDAVVAVAHLNQLLNTFNNETLQAGPPGPSPIMQRPPEMQGPEGPGPSPIMQGPPEMQGPQGPGPSPIMQGPPEMQGPQGPGPSPIMQGPPEMQGPQGPGPSPIMQGPP